MKDAGGRVVPSPLECGGSTKFTRRILAGFSSPKLASASPPLASNLARFSPSALATEWPASGTGRMLAARLLSGIVPMLRDQPVRALLHVRATSTNGSESTAPRPQILTRRQYENPFDFFTEVAPEVLEVAGYQVRRT